MVALNILERVFLFVSLFLVIILGLIPSRKIVRASLNVIARRQCKDLKPAVMFWLCIMLSKSSSSNPGRWRIKMEYWDDCQKQLKNYKNLRNIYARQRDNTQKAIDELDENIERLEVKNGR